MASVSERLAHRPSLLGPALTVLVPLLVLLIASGRVKVQPVLVSVVLVAVVLARAAASRPRAALVVLLVAGAAIPYYDGRYVTRSLALTPVAALCLLALPAALGGQRALRPVVLDWVVGTYFLLPALALVLNFGRGVGAAAGTLLSSALPYLVGRLLVSSADRARLAAVATVAVAMVLSVFALSEHATGQNPFFTFVRPTYQAGQWAKSEYRFGTVRAEASFGHPIALGLFLVIAVVLALGLYLTATGAQRWFWLTGVGLIGVALTSTLSRGPMVAAAGGAVLLLVLGASRIDVRRLAVLLVLVLGLSSTTSVLSTVSDLRNSSSAADSREAASAQYRFKILDVVLDPAQFSLLGKEADLDQGQAGVDASTSNRTSLKSIDSQFALIYLAAGLLALLAYVGVVALLVAATARRGFDVLSQAWAIAVAAVALDGLTVALLTQQGELWWFAVAVVAGLLQRTRTAVPA
ncbi:MAG: hypothetical protein JWO22_3430 [Frankiales bacterium]|nr:hypothetical protein [Frankiales bacterium]